MQDEVREKSVALVMRSDKEAWQPEMGIWMTMPLH